MEERTCHGQGGSVNWQLHLGHNVKLTHNSTPEVMSTISVSTMSQYCVWCDIGMIIRPNWAKKVCYMILFIGGPVDWEGGPVDWRAWETWMGDIGYRGRGCVTKVDWGRLRELRVWIRKWIRNDDGRTNKWTEKWPEFPLAHSTPVSGREKSWLGYNGYIVTLFAILNWLLEARSPITQKLKGILCRIQFWRQKDPVQG